MSTCYATGPDHCPVRKSAVGRKRGGGRTAAAEVIAVHLHYGVSRGGPDYRSSKASVCDGEASPSYVFWQVVLTAAEKRIEYL